MAAILTRSVRVFHGGVLRVLAAICAPLACLFVIGGLRVVFAAPGALLLGLMFSIPVALHLWHARKVSGLPIQATPEAIIIGPRRIERRNIDGVFEADENRLTMVLRDHTRFEIEVEQPASEVVDGLGFDRRQRVYRVPLRTLFGAFTKGFLTFVGSMLVLCTLAISYENPLWLLGAFLSSMVLTALVVRVFGAPRLVIGSDGLRLEHGLSRRFVSFAQVETIQRESDSGVLLTLHGGEQLALDTDGQSEALIRRVQSGQREYRDSSDSSLALARGERSLVEWRRNLEALVARPPSYREQPIRIADLLRELSDAGAPADRRIGAALLLRSQAPEEHAQIRVVADTCADERMRIALEAVVDDSLDEAMLERATRRDASRDL